MGDMAKVIIPKSDQLNADDLIADSMTIKITEVTVRGVPQQPVSIHFDGDNGKPYKPNKSMCKIMVTAWGADSKAYVGRSMTLYRDSKVVWGGLEVGGIKISHMSDIDDKIVLALTITRGDKKPHTVQPLKVEAKSAPAQTSSDAAHEENEALLIKAREFAECGTAKYSEWWGTLTADQRKSIGADRHAKFKEIAAKVI